MNRIIQTAPSREHTVDHPEFWENLYRTKRTPWELGKPAPPLVSLMKSPYAPDPGRILVLGCGSGHDCMLFAEYGFEVTGLDFAPSAVQATHERFVKAGISGTRGFLLQRDVFDIHEYDQYYDYVLEHCCFSGIDPSRRRTYVRTVKDLLKPGGKFIALWWLVQMNGGPPFSVDRDDIYALFVDHFHFDLVYEPKDSVRERAGAELLTIMSPK